MRTKKYDVKYHTDKELTKKYSKGGISRKGRVNSDYDKLKTRIYKEFPKRKLVGDIPVSDREFQILIEYLQAFYRHLQSQNWRMCTDQLICVAMVQIGIRFYDGNYWRHLKRLLDNPSWNESRQVVMGKIFINTLKENEKIILSERDRISTVLLHGFVSNYYAPRLMDFLYAYYRIDLERDLSRNDRFMMRELMSSIKSKDNTNRTYQLVKQTSDAISLNPRGGYNRIRWLLKMIDRFFWGDDITINPANRLARMFSEWTEQSDEMQQARNETGPRQRAFSSPHISFNPETGGFSVLLPSQMVKTNDDISWRCMVGATDMKLSTDAIESVLAYKTLPINASISSSDIFSRMEFILSVGQSTRQFIIPEEKVRYFNKDGVSIASANLRSGEYYAFSGTPHAIMSSALIETRKHGQLWFYYLNFEDGDIVKTAEGKVLSIGKKIEEGLLQRGYVHGTVEASEGLRVYRSAPEILIKIKKSRLPGTAVCLNGVKEKLEEVPNLTEIPLEDGSDNTGYWLDTSDIGGRKSGKYELSIDVPNDRTIRSWKYVLINGLEYSFDNRAPYFFESRGTVKVNAHEAYEVRATEKQIQEDSEKGFFNFPISSEFRQLGFCMNKLSFEISVPQFEYSFDNVNWLTKKHSEIWHTKLPRKIWIRVPTKRISLEMDNGEMDDLGYSMSFEKKESNGVIECDITRFRSWINHERIRNTILLSACGRTIPFLDIIARSYVLSVLPKADFGNNRIVIRLDIVGQSDYYVDVKFEGELVGEKVPVQETQAVIYGPIRSGKYTLEVFESGNPDDFDFDETSYTSIYKIETDIINPRDLTGKKVELRSILRDEHDIFKMQFNHRYVIRDLQPLDNEGYSYEGRFWDQKNPVDSFQVKLELLEFEKLRFALVTWVDEDYGDEMEFLYDSYDKLLVREELHGLCAAEKYRRYECVFTEDYLFEIKVLS